MKIQAVILDFDGVINDSTIKGLERIVQIARDAGHKIPDNIDQTLRKNWGIHGTKLIEICFGLDPVASQTLYRKWEKVDATQFFPLVKGAEEALISLRCALKLKVGMLTNRNRENLLVRCLTITA